MMGKNQADQALVLKNQRRKLKPSPQAIFGIDQLEERVDALKNERGIFQPRLVAGAARQSFFVGALYFATISAIFICCSRDEPLAAPGSRRSRERDLNFLSRNWTILVD